MFVRKLRVEYTRAEKYSSTAGGSSSTPCPIGWIDNFAMRNFTNSAVFDDTLPLGDGRMEVGLRVPLDALARSMEDWFRRKGYLRDGDRLVVRPEETPAG